MAKVMLKTEIGAMLTARTAFQQEFARLHRSLLTLVHADPVCRQLMSVPGVGAIISAAMIARDRVRRFSRLGLQAHLTRARYCRKSSAFPWSAQASA